MNFQYLDASKEIVFANGVRWSKVAAMDPTPSPTHSSSSTTFLAPTPTSLAPTEGGTSATTAPPTPEETTPAPEETDIETTPAPEETTAIPTDIQTTLALEETVPPTASATLASTAPLAGAPTESFTSVPIAEEPTPAPTENAKPIEGSVINSTSTSISNQSSTHNDSMLESAWGFGTKVICPGFGFSSAACYGALQTSRPSVIVAWSGGTSTAALGYALHQNSASGFAAWVVTHPDYTWSGTAYDFYRNALSGNAFSFLNSKLYIGMGCGAYYYLLHDFASSEDMAKALATSGGESFTGNGRVNSVDLRNCADNFGLGSSAWKGSLGYQYNTGRYVNVENYLLYSTSTATAVQSLVNAAWSDWTLYPTTQNFQSANCLCTKNGCNFGC